jgi:hypothetical protein
MDRYKAITKMATEKAIQASNKKVVFLYDGIFAGMKVANGFSLPLVGRTSTYLHASQQGWVAVTPRGREVVILDDVVRPGTCEIADVVYP